MGRPALMVGCLFFKLNVWFTQMERGFSGLSGFIRISIFMWDGMIGRQGLDS